jgi:pantoate--beta-alanine ligase
MTALQTVTTREGLRQALGGARPGLVPTMGALHAGHLALISRSASENPLTVVSIFVNPTQFTNPDDLARYPRDLEADGALARQAGADLIFAPEVGTIYPPGFETAVEVGHLSDRWEGASRPGHFRAVATVVTILLNLAQPARSYFGEKDFQQLQVIRQIHRDLALPGEIVGCPTVRDDHGLALSSRNVHLSREERARASALPRAIAAVCAAAARGETDARQLEVAGLAQLDTAGVTVDYLALVDSSSLEPLQSLRRGARLLMAASVGGTRLIDNAAIEPPEFEAAQGDIGQESMVATRSCR